MATYRSPQAEDGTNGTKKIRDNSDQSPTEYEELIESINDNLKSVQQSIEALKSWVLR